ncbi:MAG: hypothetical protein LUD50_05015 [Clostridia bacterium]|nr:hypothetical protein [Clostridia bacterium]
MATSSIFATFVLDDNETMDMLAEKLKEFEETEVPDSEEGAPDPCATLEEVHEFFKDFDVDDQGL